MLHTKTTEYSDKAITTVSPNCLQKLERMQNTAQHATTSTPMSITTAASDIKTSNEPR
jgi:hypothetical protein